MPRRNRVDPFGEMHAVPERGTLMGNRGNLHTDAGEVVRPFKRKEWVSCLLEYKGRHRQVMAPGRYTELFFLDEATAFAAGHRPCGTCRREALQRFRECWLAAGGPTTDLKAIDDVLHAQRLYNDYATMRLSELPDGVFVLDKDTKDQPQLWWKRHLLQWSFSGYQVGRKAYKARQVQLVTPPLLLDILNQGYPLAVHDSAESMI